MAVVPGADGWLAWGLPGGEPARAEPTAEPVLPLRAVLRVTQSDGEVRLEPSAPIRALFDLRQSVQSGELTGDNEDTRLDGLAALAEDIDVGVIHTVLGKALSGPLRGFLEAGRRGGAAR